MKYDKIALTGKARAGKDEVARYLREKYGYTTFAFGDELKRYAHELFGTSEAKPRELYQWFGQTMRERDPDIWVRKCFENIKRYSVEVDEICSGLEVSDRVIITDLRQPNEYEACRSEGYTIIRVNADDETRLARMRTTGDSFNEADLSHETESHIGGFAVDYEIYNGWGTTLGGLHAQIDAIMA